MNDALPYVALGEAIAAGRRAAGMQRQSELAQLLGIRQQSVSRWESGLGRPRPNQLTDISKVLGLRLGDLQRLGGYVSPSTRAFLAQLPLERLLPESFETFLRDLMLELYPGATARRAGGTGHAQDGNDVEVVLPDGTTIDIQCKRVAQFGPADVHKVLTKYTRSATRRILALSRVASPDTAAAVQASAGWELWDKDDLSAKFRTLPSEIQVRLVDTYFQGERLEGSRGGVRCHALGVVQ